MIKKKGWKPSADIEQALSHVPSDLIFLAVGDPRETTPGLLASLPGTLQTQINTIIAMSAAGPAAAGPGNAGPGGNAGWLRCGGPAGGPRGFPAGRAEAAGMEGRCRAPVAAAGG